MSSSSSQKPIILAFDLYGTLLSTSSIAQQLSSLFDSTDKGQQIATLWRRYQLEYTWRLNSMNQYQPFDTITQRALHHALAELELSLPASAVADLMKAYDSLSSFPDVPPALQALSSSRDSIRPVVFSNGTHTMVANSVHRSPDLSPHANVFETIVTVEEVRKFKPHPDVYRHLARKVGVDDEEEMGRMWLVSGNPFDVVGARSMGMQAAWVDRGGAGWSDRLMEGGEEGRPTVIVKGLGEVVEAVRKWAGL